MAENKTKPTQTSVADFLAGVPARRQEEARVLIPMMEAITGEPAVMWGESIIGFGSQHYRYETGREGDMPRLAFSPRKANLTVYFNGGFDRFGAELSQLGRSSTSVSCLYIPKLDEVNLEVLRGMLEKAYQEDAGLEEKPKTVTEYLARVPQAARAQFAALREIVRECLPQAQEVLSYGILGYAMPGAKPRIFISGWKDHVSIYPVPKAAGLQAEMKPYLRGKGTLWFGLEQPLPENLIRQIVEALQ